MRVAYSIGVRLGGGAIGDIALNAVLGIYRQGLLTRVFASSSAQSDIPPALIRDWGILGRGSKYLGAKDASGLMYHLEGILFDAWVAMRLPACDLFHGWNTMCLRTLRKAKQRGAITIVERASSHPATQFRLLQEEYARWNVPLRLPRWSFRRAIRELDEADYITVPSQFARHSMIEAGIAESKLLEIPFGVDLDRFQPAPSSAAHLFRVIFAGQVSVRKGVPYLLEAWQRLRWSDAELWLVGGIAPDFATLRRRWAHLPGVRFVPHSSQIASLFQQSDVFVFPSIEEGSALVTYEAMACGLPIITTPNAGSVARDGVDGFIVPIRDVNALCDRLERLRSDGSLRKQMGQSGIRRAEEFPWPGYQSRLVAHYDQMVKK